MSLVSDIKERKCASDRLYSGCCPGDWARSIQIGTDGSKSVPNMQKNLFFREPQLQRKSLEVDCWARDSKELAEEMKSGGGQQDLGLALKEAAHTRYRQSS